MKRFHPGHDRSSHPEDKLEHLSIYFKKIDFSRLEEYEIAFKWKPPYFRSKQMIDIEMLMISVRVLFL